MAVRLKVNFLLFVTEDEEILSRCKASNSKLFSYNNFFPGVNNLLHDGLIYVLLKLIFS